MNRLYQHFALHQAAAPGLIPCVWMQAGVVDYKLCDRSFDCDHCPFDDAFHRHSDQPAASINDPEPSDLIDVRGCRVKRSLFYSPRHAWARIEEGGLVRIGLDDFGQNILGRIYAVSLPAPGDTVSRGSPAARLTHQYGVSALVAPVSGRVKEINLRLAQEPSLLNHDSYGHGWLVLVEPRDLRHWLKRLRYGERAAAWLQREVEKLHLIVNWTVSGELVTMPDGGTLTQAWPRELNIAQRQRVIDSFFPLSMAGEAESNNAISEGLERKRLACKP